ncbi:Fanconi anemia group D2 protein [Podila humilis]|nr:Fanconi anemia group D2 protein [Podila humilis]
MSMGAIQRDIVVALPEIVPDSEHRPIVDGLVELMEGSTELLVPVLDALSNLNLQTDILRNARENVMDRLESAELDDLPVVIKFLLQTVEPETVDDVVDTLRQKLDIKSIHRLQGSAQSKKKSISQTPEVLILDALKTGLQFQKFVTDAWFKALVAIDKASGHKVIDVMVLVILHSIANRKKKTEALIRQKIIDGVLTTKLLKDTISVHGASLREFMPSILSLSENLLRSSANHPIVVRAASSLYTSAFEVSDAYYRQEIVGSLLVHLGSGSRVEIDASLSVLQDLVQLSRASLNEFSGFMKGLLDYLDNMTLEQIRLFIIILGSLAREDEVAGNPGNLLSDMSIIFRKQLSHPTENYKKVGVMGAIAIVHAFGAKEADSRNRSAGSSSQAVTAQKQAESDPLLKISVHYLRMIKNSCQTSPACLSLAYDELAIMVRSRILESALVDWIKEEFSNQFAGTFVYEDSDNLVLRPNLNIAIEPWMNMDGPDAQLSICILSKLCEDIPNTGTESPLLETPDAVICLCSLFKLLQATVKASGDIELEEIDGVLGCSVSLFKRDYLQGVLCTISWFRELCNAFSETTSDQVMARIILRLKHILELEQVLHHVLASVPAFKPLEMNAIKTMDTPKTLSLPSFSGGIVIQPSHGKGSARRDDSISSVSKPVTTSLGKSVTYESIAPYVRELEMSAFNVLRIHEPLTREAYTGAEMPEKVELFFPELLFVLKDLHAKVTFKLASPTTSAPFGRKPVASSVNNSLLVRMSYTKFVESVLHIIPHIVTRTRIMLKALSNNDEIVSVNNETTSQTTVDECLTHALQILQIVVSWKEFKCSDRKELRMNLLRALAIDNKSEDKVEQIRNSVNLSEVAAVAFHGLAAWRNTVPDFASAALLLEILDQLLDLVPRNPKTSGVTSEFAKQILSERWPGAGSIKPVNIAFVVGKQIERYSRPLEVIEEYAMQILPKFLNGEDGLAQSHPMLSDSTFTTFTKVLYKQLASLVGNFSQDSFDDTEAAFQHVLKMAQCFHELTGYVKVNDTKDVLSVTLKNSKVFMEQFIRRVLPFLGNHFKGYQEPVARIFKRFLQPATRSLQNICGHAKATKEQSLVSLVPSIKKTMEVLIFQVKLMLETNDARAAFWLGNLKHRNLAGEEISAELPEEPSEPEEEEEEEDEEEEENAKIVSENDDDDAIDGMGDIQSTGRSVGKKDKAKAKANSNKAVAQASMKGKGKAIDVKGKPRKDGRGKTPRSVGIGSSNAKPSVAGTKRKFTKKDPVDDESRIHTSSQISNSDMSDEEEQDQLDEEQEEEEEEEDKYGDRAIEKQDERSERQRRVRNPYIDDAAESGDDDDEEDEDEDEDEDDEEEEEEEEEEEDEMDEAMDEDED